MKFTILDRIVFWLTANRWNRLISLVLIRYHSKQTINSIQLHVLTAEFDPTQNAAFKRIEKGNLMNRDETEAERTRQILRNALAKFQARKSA